MRGSEVLGSFKTSVTSFFVVFFDNFGGPPLDFWASKLVFFK